MWFTQVSLRNPVFATMVMLAFVVLGVFGYQRLQVDQFPNVDFPVVVVNTAYPGASPEIVEVEVSRKIEEALNTISGINALVSRSYQGASVVIAEFQLDVDSRKAADDVREKVAAVKASLRDEVEEPRIQRFDPASRPIFSVAVTRDTSIPNALTPSQASNWADQVLRKKIENVRGVGAVSLVGNTERAIQIELKPQAMRALGVTAEQIATALRSENQDAPVWVSAWLATSFVQEQVVPGVEILAESASLTKLETSYEKDGVVVGLKSPRRSVIFGGTVSAVAPEGNPLPEIVYAKSESTSAYVQAFRAKQAMKSANLGTDSF